MSDSTIRTMAIGVILTAMAAMLPAQNTAIAVGPADLQVDNLKAPMGIDDPAPRFSWQLHDPCARSRCRLHTGSRLRREQIDSLPSKPDVWDSGRVESAHDRIGVPYGGPALKPSTRYYWHIELWGAAGQEYRATPIDWWETGLMNQDAWHAQWIGYETPEEATVRHAPAAWIANPDAKTPAGGQRP